MNIFHVLSQGKSRLNEPSMSAMLGYLLDSGKDHGLGDSFIRTFLTGIDKNAFEKFLAFNFIRSESELEVQYDLNGTRKDIDIEILLSDNHDDDHKYKIIIENKIKVGSANPKQLQDYYAAILQDDKSITDLYIIFITPENTARALNDEYESLNLSNNSHHKKWLYWSSSSQTSIVSMLRNVLNMEADGTINPINEYMRHTLKAFIKHASVVTKASTAKSIRIGENIGEVIEEQEITLQSGDKYLVVKRDSTQIQVFNLLTGEKQVARHILSQYIDEHDMQIPYASLNTRGIGKQFFEWFKQEKNKVIND